jgi:ABC-type glycerol-3-phosphate transport system substrate-binding protein
MKMKKWIALMLVVLMTVSVIGCASTSQETTEAPSDETTAAEAAESAAEEPAEHEPVTITFGSWVFPEESVNYIYQEILDNFMAEYPWITVEIYTNSYADYLEQLVVAAAAGTGPDVAHIKNTWLAQLVEIGAVLPVNDYLSAETVADYSESAIDAVTDENGDMMAVDWFGNTESLIYNKDLLAKAAGRSKTSPPGIRSLRRPRISPRWEPTTTATRFTVLPSRPAGLKPAKVTRR